MLNNKNNCPIILLGDSGVGKSSITIKFLRDQFEDTYNPTVENSYIAELEVEIGEKIRLEILDTAGQEEFSNLLDHYARIGEAFILVYSITCRGSFNEIKHIKENISNIKQSLDVPMILVGNKVDLSNNERKVSIEEGRSLARSFGCSFLETSAKDNINIEQCFKTLVKQWKKSKERKFSKNGTVKKSGYTIKNITMGRKEKKNICIGDKEFYENFEIMNNANFSSSKRSNSSNSIYNNNNNINNNDVLKHNHSLYSINNNSKISSSKISKSNCFLQ